MASLPSSTTAPVDLRERLDVLFWQEATAYKTEDYLSVANANLRRWREEQPGREHQGESVTSYWREVVCEWAYNLVDHFDISRERVSVFTNLLDRHLYHHLTTHAEPIQKSDFQLLAVTCLYLAIKLDGHPRKYFTLDLMTNLSRGKFNKEQMTKMELVVLNGLNWEVHPPTPLVFLGHFLLLLQPKSEDHHYQLFETARYFLELAALDYHFVTETPSRVALAALLNAISEGATVHFPLHVQDYLQYEELIEALIDNSNPRVREAVERCRLRLVALFGHSEPGSAAIVGANLSLEPLYTTYTTASPRSVAV